MITDGLCVVCHTNHHLGADHPFRDKGASAMSITDRDIETYKAVGAFQGIVECAEAGMYDTREKLLAALKVVKEHYEASRSVDQHA